VNILDIGQAVIHDTLSFGILVEIPTPSKATVLKASCSRATARTSRCVSRRFRRGLPAMGGQSGQETPHRHPADPQSDRRAIAAVSSITAKYGLNIDHIDRLSGRMPLDMPADKGKGCIEFSVRGEAAIRRRCVPTSSAWPRS
jgi:phosphoserine phosphatase